jgi:ATP-dependent DNA helicase RecQ
VILLNGAEDDEIQEYFITTAFPEAPAMQAVLDALEETGGATLRGLQVSVNLSQTRIEQALKLLEVEGAVARDGTTYFRTVNLWTPDEVRQQRVTNLRRHELEQMRAFVRSDACLMEFVARELDDRTAEPCGRCAICSALPVQVDVPLDLIQQAITFLKRDARPIEPRKSWPSGWGGPTGRSGADIQNAPGYALCIFGDAGWGRAVAEGKYQDGHFSDDLVRAAVELIRDRWAPHPAPAWVTAVPSLRHSGLVLDFARRMAVELGLPFRQAITKERETLEQKTMQNSAQQAANIWDAFRVAPSDVSAGPVLLVDDIVDSGWTFAVCGYLLCKAGSGTVYPFALATAAGARRPP